VTGQLLLVATPIGNLADLSPRAADALTAADLLCCEDTRRTAKLYSHLGVKRPPTIVINEHTERDQAGRIVEAVASGQLVVLVSDAGMPAVSDPGEALVRAVVAAGLIVSVVPGPSAVLAALATSGLPTQRFVMDGFLPRSGPARRSALEAATTERRTVVLFEAPHRLARTLADLIERCGADRRLVLARELTKVHEELWRGTLAEAVAHTEATEPRGEYVLVLEGAPPAAEATSHDARAALQTALDRGASRRDAVDQVARDLQLARNVVYELALALDREA
jgi:16S rRNA (cytidine1402-2'-O)-methyltransferase